jgi:hypothetical protein
MSARWHVHCCPVELYDFTTEHSPQMSMLCSCCRFMGRRENAGQPVPGEAIRCTAPSWRPGMGSDGHMVREAPLTPPAADTVWHHSLALCEVKRVVARVERVG